MTSGSDGVRSLRQCVDCGTTAPPTQTGYTLIGAEHGWRLSREKEASGKVVMQWRCPKCWARHKSLSGKH